MHALRHSLLLIIAAAVMFLASAEPSFAAYEQLECDGEGGVANGQLFYAIEGTGGGDSGEGSCKFEGLDNIFSQVICYFVLVLNRVMGQFYCGLQYALTGTLSILLTLYVAVFGAQMLMGTAQLNAKEVIIRLLKIAAVWALATESAWGIGFLFNFVIVVMNDMSYWVIEPLRTGTVLYNYYLYIPFFGTITIPIPTGFFIPAAAADQAQGMPIFGFMDKIIWEAFFSPLRLADNKLIGFFMTMMIVFPPLYALAGWWLWTTFITLMRTVLGFLMCLAAIAFLISLSPIFLSFMLFQSTSHFFENWLRYLISYVVQVVLVFAIIVLWIVVISHFVWFFNDLQKVVAKVDPVMVPGPMYDPTNTWGICPYDYSEDATGKPYVKCQDASFNTDPEANPDGWEDDMSMVILPTKITNEGNFIYYIIYHLISLILITYAFSALMQKSHEIARNLAGPSHVTPLVGGLGASGFGGLFGHETPRMLRDSPGRHVRGLVDNMHGMVGRR